MIRLYLILLLLLVPTPAASQLLNLSGKGVAFNLKQPEPPPAKQTPAVAPPKPPPPQKTSELETAICQCRGSNRKACFCLKANVKCGCNPRKGSEWTLQPLKKTGRYFDPNTPPPAIKAPSGPQKKAAAPVSYPVTVDEFGRLAWTVGGRYTFLPPGYRLTDGQTDGSGRWMFRNWRMIDTSAQPVEARDTSKPASTNRRAIYFGASWCGPCQWVTANTLPQLPGFPIRRVDADEDPGLVQRYQITGLPTLVILDNGQEVDRIVGQFTAATARKAFSRKAKP